MPFSENPHLNELYNSLVDEGIGKLPIKNIKERAAMFGLSEREYRDFIQNFPYLTHDEAYVVLQRVIAWYQANTAIQKVITTSLGGSTK